MKQPLFISCVIADTALKGMGAGLGGRRRRAGSSQQQSDATIISVRRAVSSTNSLAEEGRPAANFTCCEGRLPASPGPSFRNHLSRGGLREAPERVQHQFFLRKRRIPSCGNNQNEHTQY